MTFDKQVKEAKEKQLQSRIVRDVVFLILGITFLAISIFSSIKENQDKKEAQNSKTTVTTTINK